MTSVIPPSSWYPLAISPIPTNVEESSDGTDGVGYGSHNLVDKQLNST